MQWARIATRRCVFACITHTHTHWLISVVGCRHSMSVLPSAAVLMISPHKFNLRLTHLHLSGACTEEQSRRQAENIAAVKDGFSVLMARSESIQIGFSVYSM